MRDRYAVTLGNFLLQIAKGIENPADEVRSIGTWSGADAPARYTVNVRRADGTEYEINIQADYKLQEEKNRG